VSPAVLPGAEAWSAPGGPAGALVIHGFTGCPQSMRGLAEAFASAGFTVELPRLPGHGTTVEDMATTGWADWSGAVEAAYRDLAGRCERVVAAGLSMGGTLAAWVGAHHPELAGLVLINAAVGMADDDLRKGLEDMLSQGIELMPGVAGDIADPDADELGYDQVPVRSLLSLGEAMLDLEGRLADIRCPVLILNSPQDHVVPPGASDRLAGSVSGPVERVTLEHSFHVATLDHDKEVIERAAVDFARRVTPTA
jgi:carboxylesterase